MTLQAVQKGGSVRQILRADDNNLIRKAARQVLGANPQPGANRQLSRLADTIKVQNSTGADVDRFDVSAINGSLFAPVAFTPPAAPTIATRSFLEAVSLNSKTPAAADIGKAIVWAEPVADGKTGHAYVQGMAVARIDHNSSDSLAGWCDLEDAHTTGLSFKAYGSNRVIYYDATSSYAIIDMAVRPQGTPIQLNLASDSGNATSDPPDWTYTGTDPQTGFVCFTNKSPDHNRWQAEATAATKGLAVWDGSAWDLFQTDEIMTMENC